MWGCSGGCWTPKRSAVTVGGGQAEGRLVRYFGLRFCGVFEAPRPREDPGRRPRSLRSPNTPSTPPTPLPGPSQGRQEAGPELPASQRPPCSHPTAEAAQSTLGLPKTPDPSPPPNPSPRGRADRTIETRRRAAPAASTRKRSGARKGERGGGGG